MRFSTSTTVATTLLLLSQTAIYQSVNAKNWGGNFKDATVEYYEKDNYGTRLTCKVSELPELSAVTTSFTDVIIKLGPLSYTLNVPNTTHPNVVLFYDPDMESLGITNTYKFQSGQYMVEQVINKVIWDVTFTDDESATFKSLTYTAPTGQEASSPLPQYFGGNTKNGKVKITDNTVTHTPFNTNPVTKFTLFDMGANNSNYSTTLKDKKFYWHDMAVEYESTAAEVLELDNFRDVKALDLEQEFTYTGQAVVTWYDPICGNLWMRDGNGVAMYFRDCPALGDVRKGAVLSGTFQAKFREYETVDNEFNNSTNKETTSKYVTTPAYHNERNQICCTFVHNSKPTFSGMQEVIPHFFTPIASEVNLPLGTIPTEYVCDLVGCIGTMINGWDNFDYVASHPGTAEIVFGTKSFLIESDNGPIVCGITQQCFRPFVGNADALGDQFGMDSDPNTKYFWKPHYNPFKDPYDTDAKTYYPQANDANIVGQQVIVYGLAMRSATDLQIWPLYAFVNPNLLTGIENMEVKETSDAPAEYYTLSGMRAGINPAPGLYIRRQGGRTEKVIIR